MRNRMAPLPYFSADAGGAPGPLRGMGETPGIPPLNLPGVDILGALSSAGFAPMGIFTPWGELTSGSLQVRVTPIGTPDTNIALYNAAAVQRVLDQMGVGRAPFMAILASAPLPNELVDAALINTPYSRFQAGIATYRQDDMTGVPKMYFVYWIQERPAGDPLGGNSSALVSAHSMGATLNFAQQVDVNQTTNRNPPTVGVAEAANVQYPMVFPRPGPGESPPPPLTPPVVTTAPPFPGGGLAIPPEVLAFAECVGGWLGVSVADLPQNPQAVLSRIDGAIKSCSSNFNLGAYLQQAEVNPVAAATAAMVDLKAACPELPNPITCFPGAPPPQGPPPGQPQVEPTTAPPTDELPPATAAAAGGGLGFGIFALGVSAAFVGYYITSRKGKR